ncbi:SCO family protein [Leptospira kanakyensis]|uniref:SCO family protein n=1 Tax=Leptospira kanakyensis TaxID=2484968 RepID=UPI00223E4046|nr:SCO family protein [Leptospira kanakyensis]MCW7470222.1 SCO family protein [Leptospira kanakyensis]MCW7481202.1 SCO family protein [Leptospira kanakyensis]
MKNTLIVRTLVLFFCFSFYSFCDDHHSHADHQHGEGSILAASEGAKGSLFDLPISWKMESGQTFLLNQIQGSPFVISMFYASCQSVCPRLVADMEELAKKIKEKTGKDPRMVLVSFDSEKDNPTVLNAYKKKMKLGENWSFLSGKEEDVRMLSVVLGINYKKISNGEFNHSAVYSLVSKEGWVVSRVEGVGSNTDSLINMYQKL